MSLRATAYSCAMWFNWANIALHVAGSIKATRRERVRKSVFLPFAWSGTYSTVDTARLMRVFQCWLMADRCHSGFVPPGSGAAAKMFGPAEMFLAANYFQVWLFLFLAT